MKVITYNQFEALLLKIKKLMADELKISDILTENDDFSNFGSYTIFLEDILTLLETMFNDNGVISRFILDGDFECVNVVQGEKDFNITSIKMLYDYLVGDLKENENE